MFQTGVNNNNSDKRIGENMVKCLENVNFVTNGIYLQFKRRIICKSCTKYFTYKLSNCLVTSSLITIVELVPSITSRPSMNYPIERFITQSQSDLCLCLFIVIVPILSFLYMCNVLLVGTLICPCYHNRFRTLLLSLCYLE